MLEQHRLRMDLDRAALGASQDHQILDQPAQPLGLVADIVEQFRPARIGQAGARQKRAGAVDRRDRCTQLVGQNTQERLSELLRVLAVGDIEIDAGPARDLPRLVADREAARQDGATVAVGILQLQLVIPGRAGGNRFCPVALCLIRALGGQALHPAQVTGLFHGLTRHLEE